MFHLNDINDAIVALNLLCLHNKLKNYLYNI